MLSIFLHPNKQGKQQKKEQVKEISNHTMTQQAYSFQKNLQKIQPQGWILLFVILFFWQLLVPYDLKIEVILMAFTYSFIEWSWYTFTKEVDGRIIVVPLADKGRKGFTSVEQFVANVLYLPLGIYLYSVVFPFEHLDPCSIPYFLMIFIRIAFFPFNIWFLEIVQDRVMKYMMGINPAWDYSSAKGGMFDGAINLHHWKLWLVLGVIASTLDPSTGICLVWCMFLSVHAMKFYARCTSSILVKVE